MEGYTQRDPENLWGLRLALGVYASSLFAPRLALYFATGVMGPACRSTAYFERHINLRLLATSGGGRPITERDSSKEALQRLALEGLRTGEGTKDLTADEDRQAGGQSGTLRAAVFGINDGLVSNFSLVMGVAGANPGSRFVLLAGMAGLLAGAFSMAAGEYVSMSSQRELFENQIAIERRKHEEDPDAERRELALICQKHGIPEEEAWAMAETVMQDPEMALDIHVRQELGLNPEELGSPWGAASSSFGAFVVGAIVPVAPYLFSTGTAALIVSVVLSALALFGTGAAISTFTIRHWLSSALRMLSIGALPFKRAAGVEFRGGPADRTWLI